MNSLLDATITNIIDNYNQLIMFGVYSLWYNAQTMLPAGDQDAVPPHPGHQQAAAAAAPNMLS